MASKDGAEIHHTLADPKTPLGRKLKLAVMSELEYWQDRSLLPNLSRSDFIRLIRYVSDNQEGDWLPRTSRAGAHGATGEDVVFKFEYNITILGITSRYFVKGYFFDKEKLRGVTIQSFRLVPPPEPTPIRNR